MCDYIAYDLLIAKLEAQGSPTDALALVFSFFKNRNWGVHVNSTNSNFKNIIFRFPNGPFFGLHFSVHQLMTYFRVSIYNFTNDNTLSTFAKRIYKLISILEREFLNKVDCFNANKVIVNPDKFHSLGIDIKSRTINKKANINRYAKYKRVTSC